MSNMYSFYSTIFLFVFSFNSSVYLFGQSDIKVELHIENIESRNGQIMIAIYNSSETFLTDNDIQSGVISSDEFDNQPYSFRLSPGKYAFAVYHDKNSDNILNKNILGIPTEPYGFSGEMSFFGMPEWSLTSIEISKDEHIYIEMN